MGGPPDNLITTKKTCLYSITYKNVNGYPVMYAATSGKSPLSISLVTLKALATPIAPNFSKIQQQVNIISHFILDISRKHKLKT
jgi:hypothetical protein